MSENKIPIHLQHFKLLYSFTHLLPFNFFKELLKSKGPNLESVIEEGEKTNFSLTVIDPKALHLALKKDFPNWVEWLQGVLKDFTHLPSALRLIEATKIEYDEDRKTVRVAVGDFSQDSQGSPIGLKSRMEQVGPPIWKDLHIYAKNWNGNVDEQTSLLTKTKMRIPCGECKQFWVKEVKENPAPTDSAENFFKWTVDVHNKVNVKLGKAEMSLEEAKTLY